MLGTSASFLKSQSLSLASPAMGLMARSVWWVFVQGTSQRGQNFGREVVSALTSWRSPDRVAEWVA